MSVRTKDSMGGCFSFISAVVYKTSARWIVVELSTIKVAVYFIHSAQLYSEQTTSLFFQLFMYTATKT